MRAPSYQIERSPLHEHRRKYRRRLWPLMVLLLIVLVMAARVLLDLRSRNVAQNPVIGATTHHTIAGPKVFRSDYFQFSDTAEWKLDTKASTPNKFLYISYLSTLPAHIVTVYVNQTPPDGDLASSRALPVSIKNEKSFSVGDLSDLCNTKYAPGALKLLRTVSLSGTNMLCVPDSPQYTVIVGQVGGDYRLNLKRQNGQTAQYIITYHNVTVTPTITEFTRIMKTFQAI